MADHYTETELQDRLTEIKAALLVVPTGSAYTIDDITYTRQNIQALKTLESHTLRMLNDLEVVAAGGTPGIRQPVWR